MDLRLTCDSVAFKRVRDEDLDVLDRDEVLILEPFVDFGLRLTAGSFASLADLEDDHQVAGLVRVVTSLDHDIVRIDALHLGPVRLQESDRLRSHIEEKCIFALTHADVAAHAWPRFHFCEGQATLCLIESPLLEIELDFAYRFFLN